MVFGNYKKYHKVVMVESLRRFCLHMLNGGKSNTVTQPGRIVRYK
jgi:hypothetical protein